MKTFLKQHLLSYVLAILLVLSVYTPSASAAAQSTLKIANRTAITSIKQGSCWTTNGIISSNYNIKEVRAEISDGKSCMYSTVVYPNTKTYNLNDYSTKRKSIDYEMKFNLLKAGAYKFHVSAKDSSGKKVEFTDNFSVIGNSSLKISNYSTPPTLTEGQCWTVNGTVSSNYSLKSITGQILTSSGSVKFEKTVYPNAKSYNISDYSKGGLDKNLLFNKLPAGNYRYVIAAKDSSGTTKTLVDSRFTVSANPTDFRWPVSGNYTITQSYKGGKVHSGLDITADNKTIYAAADGTVFAIASGMGNQKGAEGMQSYGNFVTIKHKNGYFSHYAHLSSVNVKVGDAVKAGSKIGVMGNSGNSYGTHLHFEILKGSTLTSHTAMAVDPLSFKYSY